MMNTSFQWRSIQASLPVLAALAAISLLWCQAVIAAELREESDLNFAFYSSAWGDDETSDSLRLVTYNRTEDPLRLRSITFLSEADADSTEEPLEIILNLDVPAMGYADMELPYVDLLFDDECINRTLSNNWRLAEISNYTLNPSVRNLIIEDTDSFRIYQCFRNVLTRRTNLSNNDASDYEEWVLYHFESRNQRQ